MRYSIFEFSQDKLVSLGLDVADALLLNWFSHFFCGKMEKKIFKAADGSSKIYGWVKISKIIEDLPVLGISTEKGIRVRFDAFVEKGILDRETINTQKGKKSYYKTTSVYDSLINTVSQENISVENTAISQGNCSSFAEDVTEENQENNPHRSFTSFVNETTEENKENNPHRSFTSFANETTEKKQENNPQGNCSSFAEKATEENQKINSQGNCSSFAEDVTEENQKINSQGNCNSFAQGNCNSFAQGNCNSFALNNSLINDNYIKDTSSVVNNNTKKEEADFLIKKINELFKFQVNFSSDLAEKLLTSLNLAKIPTKEYENYIIWSFDYLKSRCKPENFPGYFYKSVSQTSVMFKFLSVNKQLHMQAEEIQKKLILCEICGCEHNIDDDCPKCGNNFLDLKNCTEEDILFRKNYYQLPQNLKEKYENDIQLIYSKFPPVSEIIKNKELSNALKEQLKALDYNYGLRQVLINV